MGLEGRHSPGSLAVLVVGTDTLIEVLPARPIQLAHACSALGYDLVIPLSWGDELVAEAAVQAIESRGGRPTVLCSCPVVRQRLFQCGSDLTPSVVSLVSPPVALARFLRERLGSQLGSLTFVGRCPDARTSEFDVALEPPDLLHRFRQHGVELAVQPAVFVDVVPPDRRRFASLPGGCPTPETLWQRCNETALAQLEGQDFQVELAQHLMSPYPVLVDPAPAAGCACSGVTHMTAGRSARIAAASLEPPRSPTPVFPEPVSPELIAGLSFESRPEEKAFRGRLGVSRAPMAVTPRSAIRIADRRAGQK